MHGAQQRYATRAQSRKRFVKERAARWGAPRDSRWHGTLVRTVLPTV